MSSYAYYNGEFGIKEDIRLPLSDRSIFFGDAVYDAAVGCYDRIMWEDEHIDRLLSSARMVGIMHKYDKKRLSSLLREIAVKSMIEEYFIYFQLSRSNPERHHSSIGCSSSLLVTVDPFKISSNLEEISLITVEDERHGFCNVKSVNLLPAVLSATAAEESLCDEAIYARNGIVTECSKSNISILKQGRLITHPINNRILPGITRRHLIKICDEIGVPVEEKCYNVEDMLSADEILVTSATKLCKRAAKINGAAVGGRNTELAERIHRIMYREFIDKCRLRDE